MKLSRCSSTIYGGGKRRAESISSGLHAQRTNCGYQLYRCVHYWGQRRERRGMGPPISLKQRDGAVRSGCASVLLVGLALCRDYRVGRPLAVLARSLAAPLFLPIRPSATCG